MSDDEREEEGVRIKRLYSFPKRDIPGKKNEPRILLSNICLKSICKNIDLFNSAFQEKKMDFSFLQRFFSKQIIKMLVESSGNSVLDKRYFDLFINNSLKELEFRIFGAEDLNYILEVQLPKMGNSLENVSFFFHPAVQANIRTYKKMQSEEFVKKVISQLPNVKILRMSNFSHCDDSTLEVIYSSCKELKELYLEHCHITSAGLKNLCPEGKKALNLQYLSLISIKQDYDEGISYLLKNLPSLENILYLNVANVLHKLHADDLRNNALHTVPKYNLTSLHIDESRNIQHNMESFEEALLIAADLCPRISRIRAIGIRTEKQLQILARFSYLNDVSIDGDYVGIDGYSVSNDEDHVWLDIGDFLQHTGKKLKRLRIKRFKLTLSTLVENCPNLESLILEHIDYISEKEKSGNILNNMKNLILTGIDENNGSAEMVVKLLLDSCPNLEDLEFINCFCIAQQMNSVVESQTLRNLTFTLCAMEEALLLQRVVLMCTPLKNLVIEYCRHIKSHEIEHLRDIIRASGRGVVIHFFSYGNYDRDDDLDDESDDDLDDESDEDEDNLEDDEQMDDLSGNEMDVVGDGPNLNDVGDD